MRWQIVKKSVIASAVIVFSVIAFLVTLGQYSKLILMSFSVIIFILALTRRELFNEFMHWSLPLNSYRGIALTVGVAVSVFWIETSIWSLQGIMSDFPTIGLPAQIYLWLSFTHLISYATHGLLFIYLWYKWRRILPAFLTVLFEISMSEFGFVGPQWYQFGFIFIWTWTWYFGFIVVSLSFIALRENFDLRDKRLWFLYLLGVAVLFVNAFKGFRDPWTWNDATHNFTLFPELVYESTAWYNMYINRIGKILMGSAFVFLKLKNSDVSHEN